jgi:hypothetical protein
MTTLLQVSKKIVPVEKISTLNSIWFWIAIIELLIIVLLFYKLKTKKPKSKLSDLEIQGIKKSKESEINMDNLMNNIHSSKPLYRELSRKCHPERFVNDDRQDLAQEIFKEITKHEKNFEQLERLKKRAISELNLTF